jgi:hypothetical protein
VKNMAASAVDDWHAGDLHTVLRTCVDEESSRVPHRDVADFLELRLTTAEL